MKRTLELVDQLPKFFNYDYAILGNFTLTTKTQRFLLNDYAINYNDKIESPSHHFSAVCKDLHFPKRKTYDDMLSYPFKAIPCKLSYGFYVDVAHAFSQIAEVYGYECVFREARYFGYGKTFYVPLCSTNKLARALLVSGTGKESTMREWKNHEIITRKFPNSNYAPCLRYAIQATLHAIQFAITDYTVYAHTDGAIIPFQNLKHVEHIFDRYHINWTIKGEGYTEIYNVGDYRIGVQTTRKHHVQSKKPHTNIRAINADWWLNLFQHCYEMRH